MLMEMEMGFRMMKILIRMIPINPVGAAASGDILGLIFFSIAFGLSLNYLPEKHYRRLLDLFQSGFEAMMTLTGGAFPGGRIAVNVANLGRKPYRSLSADVISILQDDLGMLLRGEIIWQNDFVDQQMFDLLLRLP